MLLGFQILVKGLLGLNRWRARRKAALAEAKAAARAASGVPLSEEEEAEERRKQAKQARETVVLDGTRWSHKSSPAVMIDANGNALSAGAGGDDEGDALVKHAPASSGIAPLAYADPDGAPLGAAALGLRAETASAEELRTAQAAAKGRATELENIAQSVLRCTLCMEQRAPEKGGSAVTECGHIFCWDCINGWAREKVSCSNDCELADTRLNADILLCTFSIVHQPECPLCRQAINPHRFLPVYNF